MWRTSLVLALIVLVQVLANTLPDEPLTFGTTFASLPQPFLAWSFRQADCISGAFGDDVSNAVTMRRNATTGSACPSRTGNSLTWSNAIIGASITSATEPNALKSDALSSSFSSLTTDIVGTTGTQNMSISMWFTVDTTISASTLNIVLFEVGGASSSSNNVIGTTSDTYQMRMTYQKGPLTNDDALILDYAYGQQPSGTLSNNPLTIPNNVFTGPGPTLESIGTSSPGTTFMMVVTLTSDATNNLGTITLGTMGTVGLGSASKTVSGGNIKHFIMPLTSVLRLGCTRNVVGTQQGLPGTVHFAAFYSQVLNSTHISSLFDAGLPNSLPVVKSMSFIFNEEATVNVNLNQTTTAFDVNGDTISGFRIKTLPSKGTLSFAGSAIGSTDFLVSDVTQLTFVSFSDFSSSDGSCSTNYTSFTFVATDGLCDRSDTSRSAANCISPTPATAIICVKEVNHAPILTPSGISIVSAFPNSEKEKGVTITCRDKDVNVTSFGLYRISILSQSSPSLGNLYATASFDGNCTGATLYDLSSPKYVYTPGQASNVSKTISFCYKTSASGTGSDTISYQCEDNAGLVTVGSTIMSIASPLVAGCGPQSTVSCSAQGSKGIPVPIMLNATDNDLTHSFANRVYYVRSFPSGSHFSPDANLFKSDKVTRVSLNQPIPGDPVSGGLVLYYIPPFAYYNAICALNEDPDIDTTSGAAICPNQATGSSLTFADFFNRPFNGCNDPTHGCLLTMEYEAAYNVAVGQTILSGAETLVIAVLDKNTKSGVLTQPSNATIDVSVLTTTSISGFYYSDAENDTFRVGVQISIINDAPNRRTVCLKYTLDDSVDTRMAWYAGHDSNPCYDTIIAKAYPTDLNSLFDNLEIARTAYNVSALDKPGLSVTVFDPIPNPGGDAASSDFDPTDPALLASSTSASINLVWNQAVLPDPNAAFRETMTLIALILGGFIIFVFLLFLVWLYAEYQPEPVPLPDDKSIPDDETMSVVTAAEREYAINGYMTGASVQPTTSAGRWLSKRLSKRSPTAKSAKEMQEEEEEEFVDPSILAWEKHYDELHDKCTLNHNDIANVRLTMNHPQTSSTTPRLVSQDGVRPSLVVFMTNDIFYL